MDTNLHLALSGALTIDPDTLKRAQAVELAQLLYDQGNANGVLSVELFGSIARGRGTRDSDFDVVLVVPRNVAKLWSTQLHEALWESTDIYDPSVAAIRQRLALELICVSSLEIEAKTGIDVGEKLDLFLFPTGWKYELPQLQRVGHHNDPDFMEKIAADAITFVPDQGFPFPVFPR